VRISASNAAGAAVAAAQDVAGLAQAPPGAPIQTVVQKPARASLRESLEDRLDQISLGVDDDSRSTRLSVLQDEVRKKRRLSRPGLSDDVEVMASILGRDRSLSGHSGVVCAAQHPSSREQQPRGCRRLRARTLQSGNRPSRRNRRDLGQLRNREQDRAPGETPGDDMPRPVAAQARQPPIASTR
jgi:hypothetical protein